jgi:hypothetical protein
MRSSTSFRPYTIRLEKRKEEKETTSSTSSDHTTPEPMSQDELPARLWS